MLSAPVNVTLASILCLGPKASRVCGVLYTILDAHLEASIHPPLSMAMTIFSNPSPGSKLIVGFSFLDFVFACRVYRYRNSF